MLRYSSSLALFALLLTACDSGGEEPLPGGLDAERSGADPRMAIVCGERNVIARSSTCDSYPNWAAERTFGMGAPGVLAQYCSYTGNSSSDITTLASHLPAGAELAADCQAVTAQGEAIQDLVGAEFDEQFGFLTGRLEPGQFANAYGLVTQHHVDVTVVDTFPNDEPADRFSDHGPMVMSVIENIACSTGNCNVTVGAELGLPRVGAVAHTERGGYNGRQSDLAKGIFAAVENSGSDNLIINLSVGWESDLFNGNGPSNMPPPVRAVYDALRYARCSDALIIASAGNSSGMTSPEAPLAPGRWEGFPAPSGNECSTDFGLPNWSDGASYAPLVHSVGGLFGLESPMATTRDVGMPRLAAAASHAVVHPRPGLDQAVVRTGTSVSAAVASGAAAIVWSLDPLQSPSEVMHRLYSYGTLTGMSSDFGGPSTQVRGVNVCQAVKSVLGPGTPAIDCGASPSHNVTALVNQVEAAAEPLESLTFDAVDECDTTIFFYPGVGEVRDCDEGSRDPWAMLTDPQPPRAGCSDCVLTTEGAKSTALLTLEEEFANDPLETVDIEIYEDDGEIHRYSITDPDDGAVAELKSNEISHYELPIDLSDAKPIRALLYMTFSSGANTEDVMLVD